MNLSVVQVGALLLVSILFASCATQTKRPVAELALAGSALESAEAAGAREHAPIEWRSAREKKQAAESAVADKNYVKARYLSEQASVDAELARQSAETRKSRMALEAMLDTLEVINRSPDDVSADE